MPHSPLAPPLVFYLRLPPDELPDPLRNEPEPLELPDPLRKLDEDDDEEPDERKLDDEDDDEEELPTR